MKCLVIINAHSVRRNVRKNIDYIKERLLTKFDFVDIVFSEYKGHIKHLVSVNAGSYHTIVVCGGDGSVHEAVNGLTMNENDCILGLIPSGTVNDYARNLGLSKNIDVCLNAILDGQFEYTDLLKNNNEIGVYVCGFGVFTGVSYDTSQKDKRLIGKIAYVLNGIKQFFLEKNMPVEVEIDDEKFECNTALVLAYNSKSIAGMPIDTLADITDGKLDVVIFYDKPNKKIISFATLFRIIRMFLFGVKNIRKCKNVILRSVDNLKITGKEPIIVNMDGEKAEECDINLSILHKRFKVYANKRKKCGKKSK